MRPVESENAMQCNQCQSDDLEEILDLDGDCVLYWIYLP